MQLTNWDAMDEDLKQVLVENESKRGCLDLKCQAPVGASHVYGCRYAEWQMTAVEDVAEPATDG